MKKIVLTLTVIMMGTSALNAGELRDLLKMGDLEERKISAKFWIKDRENHFNSQIEFVKKALSDGFVKPNKASSLQEYFSRKQDTSTYKYDQFIEDKYEGGQFFTLLKSTDQEKELFLYAFEKFRTYREFSEISPWFSAKPMLGEFREKARKWANRANQYVKSPIIESLGEKDKDLLSLMNLYIGEESTLSEFGQGQIDGLEEKDRLSKEGEASPLHAGRLKDLLKNDDPEVRRIAAQKWLETQEKYFTSLSEAVDHARNGFNPISVMNYQELMAYFENKLENSKKKYAQFIKNETYTGGQFFTLLQSPNQEKKSFVYALKKFGTYQKLSAIHPQSSTKRMLNKFKEKAIKWAIRVNQYVKDPIIDVLEKKDRVSKEEEAYPNAFAIQTQNLTAGGLKELLKNVDPIKREDAVQEWFKTRKKHFNTRIGEVKWASEFNRVSPEQAARLEIFFDRKKLTLKQKCAQFRAHAYMGGQFFTLLQSPGEQKRSLPYALEKFRTYREFSEIRSWLSTKPMIGESKEKARKWAIRVNQYAESPIIDGLEEKDRVCFSQIEPYLEEDQDRVLRSLKKRYLEEAQTLCKLAQSQIDYLEKKDRVSEEEVDTPKSLEEPSGEKEKEEPRIDPLPPSENQ